MLKHEQYEELCTLAMIGEVSSAEMQDLRHHLQECAACRDQYREFTEFLLPQLSIASENEETSRRECTEVERERLRNDFLSRAESRGLNFSRAVLNSTEVKRIEAPRPASRSSRALWQLPLGVSIAGLIFAAGYLADREMNRRRGAERATATVTAPQLSASHPNASPAPPEPILEDSKTFEGLERKLSETTSELAIAERALQESEAAQARLRNEFEEKNKQIAALETQIQGDAQTTADLRTEALDLKRRIDQSQGTTSASELRIRDLNEQLSAQTASLDREREMLSVGRDVRDLMGARSLHIIDVHDANGAGKNQKSFGRIFYTEGKSLIFYAFDLDDKRVVNADYSYQAWGERLGQPASVKSLGMLYVDDKAQRRWSLKVDDPRQLSEINSVFVTLEPRSGEGDKPRGKRILFAFLGGEANHP